MIELFYILWYMTGLCGALAILAIFQERWARLFHEPRPTTSFDVLMILVLGFAGPVSFVLGFTIYWIHHRKAH